MEREVYESLPGGLNSLERLSLWGSSVNNVEQLTAEAMTEVYSKYSFKMSEDTKNLAIHAYHDDVSELKFLSYNLNT